MSFETKALYQNDPAWKNVKLGNQNKETIGSWGCLLTALTMVVNGYGCHETPATLNEKLKAVGGFRGALLIPAAIPAVCPGIIYKGYFPCEDRPAPIAQIDAALAAGKPVVVQVDWSPKAGLQSHWVVLYEKVGDDYYMLDPYRYRGDSPDKKLKLLERYTHSGRNAAQAITGVIWIEGHTPPKPKPRVPVPKDSIDVYVAGDGLAFRDAPSIRGRLLKRLPLNALLRTLEPGDQARAKVGVRGQWLHVQDSSGAQGYVAAWYVSLDVVEEEPEEPPAPKWSEIPYHLVPIADGLAVRAQPSLKGRLLRRVPLGTVFGYLESKQEVERKVGVVNEWIHIYTADGLEGYVAAWYVTRKAGAPPPRPKASASQPAAPQQPSPAPKPAPKPTPKPTPSPSAPSPAEPSAPKPSLTVFPLREGVALRTQPVISPTTLIRRLPQVMALQVLEPEDQAKAKLGVMGQWLKVRTPGGKEGYVAAWYVEVRSPKEKTQGEPLYVRTTAPGVAFRSAPVIADHTLIKRFPQGARLTALESDARSKIGKRGAWLKVEDATGTEGFIAAWYVEPWSL